MEHACGGDYQLDITGTSKVEPLSTVFDKFSKIVSLTSYYNLRLQHVTLSATGEIYNSRVQLELSLEGD